MVFPAPAAWDAALSTESSHVAEASVFWRATSSQEGKSAQKRPCAPSIIISASSTRVQVIGTHVNAVRRPAHVLAVLAGQEMMSSRSWCDTACGCGAAVETADQGRVGRQSCIVCG